MWKNAILRILIYAFDYMKSYISRKLDVAFPDNDTLRTVHGNALFIECKNQALNLTMHITTEERRQAYKEKYGQAGNQRWVS